LAKYNTNILPSSFDDELFFKTAQNVHDYDTKQQV